VARVSQIAALCLCFDSLLRGIIEREHAFALEAVVTRSAGLSRGSCSNIENYRLRTLNNALRKYRTPNIVFVKITLETLAS